MYKLKFHEGETKKKIISRSVEHQQENIKDNRSSSATTKHTMEWYARFDLLHPKTISIRNRYNDRKTRELLKIDMAVIKYRQDKALNRDHGNFVKTNA